MKTRNSSVWIYTTIVAVVLIAASCMNTQKKKEKTAEIPMSAQPMDSVTIIESETVIMIDSLASDSSAMQKPAPEKAK